MKYNIHVDVDVLNIDDFEEEMAPLSDPGRLFRMMARPEIDPLENGFEILSGSVAEIGQDRSGNPRLRFAATIEIHDPEKTIIACREAWESMWGGGDDAPADPGRAAMELLFQSNANDSPYVLGFAFQNDGVQLEISEETADFGL